MYDRENGPALCSQMNGLKQYSGSHTGLTQSAAEGFRVPYVAMHGESIPRRVQVLRTEQGSAAAIELLQGVRLDSFKVS